jgi:stearoyl-CoA desaturase (delta-9 desaturase)
MRFWLWLTTGMVTKQWVAVHRKHHRYSDIEGDPHTPNIYGIWNVLFKGAVLYSKAAKDSDMVNMYGVGTPDDNIEKFYTKYNALGIMIMLWINLTLFGPIVGFVIWGIQMLWIPFWAAGVINGVAHWIGYRNGNTNDTSRNISPLGIIVGGEELHNNHHLEPRSIKFSKRWFEFDIGYFYLRILCILKLAEIRN